VRSPRLAGKRPVIVGVTKRPSNGRFDVRLREPAKARRRMPQAENIMRNHGSTKQLCLNRNPRSWGFLRPLTNFQLLLKSV
jgi:hypothetical protein